MHAADARCVRCGHSTPDVRMGCSNGCCFHARCLDLKSVRLSMPSADVCGVKQCPRCATPSTGMEILPLSFEEIDQARRLVGASGSSSKRTFGVVNSGGAQTGGGDVYDPAVPRAGKWAEEEIAFRDTLVTHFVSGSLPLPNELKLCEFLSKILKSKPSRLTKKMKKANLSTRHFVGNSSYIEDDELAKELSKLELSFVNSIVEPVERSEIKFHMQREWRDYLAARCTVLNIRFEGTEWLKSIENMENRIALARTRDRSVKRRLMMGRAIETDAGAAEATPGVFIDNSEPQDEIDFDVLASAIETNGDYDDADFRNLYLSLVDDPAPTAAVSDNSSQRSNDDPTAAMQKTPVVRKGLLMSSAAPNLKFAAPFLSRAASYIEHNQLPFEHIDIWVPTMTTSLEDPSGATSIQPCLGSGALDGRPGRLCFAGSYSLDVHMVNDPQTSTLKQVALPRESVYNLLLFGSYSEKFSFSSGCGLPGRVYESAVPAWEQFITNAPSHLFERRGGAMQFGIKTALGLPIESTNVGRIVLVMYSKEDRIKDDYLVANIISDLQKLNPCPRWKLVVDLGNGSNDVAVQNGSTSYQVQVPSQQPNPNQGEFNDANIIKSSQIKELISILGENMPSDYSSPLGQQINDIMSLRLVLLKSNRSPEEEQLVDSILLLFSSYLKAGRSRADISQMVTRDYAFHLNDHQRNQQQQFDQRNRGPSISNLQHLSINNSSPRF